MKYYQVLLLSWILNAGLTLVIEYFQIAVFVTMAEKHLKCTFHKKWDACLEYSYFFLFDCVAGWQSKQRNNPSSKFHTADVALSKTQNSCRAWGRAGTSRRVSPLGIRRISVKEKKKRINKIILGTFLLHIQLSEDTGRGGRRALQRALPLFKSTMCWVQRFSP